jgi:hypothetical protein
MKTNGYFLTLVAILWLSLTPPGYSQGQNKEILRNPKVFVTSQIDKNPVDLISTHIKQSLQSRNAFSSPSNLAVFHSDSIIYYSGTNLNNKETFSYDSRGNLISYLKETRGPYGWLLSELETFTYDDNGNVLTDLKQTWVNFFWEKNYLLTYTYDDYGNMLTYLIQKREFNHWTNYNLYEYTYNENHSLVSCLEQYWQSEEWINSCLSTNHFDDRGNLDISIRQVWSGSAWLYSSRNLNTFNQKGSLLTSQVQYWTDYNWVNSELYTYTYDDNEHMLLKLMQYFSNDTWINFILNVNTYDIDGNCLTNCELYWVNEDWTYYSLVTRTFDENANMLSELSQEWNETWNDITNSLFTYDENGNCTSTTWFSWNSLVWENISRVEYEYTEGMIRGTGFIWDGAGWINGDAMLSLQFMSGDAKLPLCDWWGSMAEVYYTALYTNIPGQVNDDQASINVFPNPATDVINISWNNLMGQPSTVNIYDLSGKLADNIPGNNLVSGNTELVSIDKLSPGMYFIELRSGTQSFIQKFTVSR